MKSRIIKVETYEVEQVDPPRVDQEAASKEKGYPHPGSFIKLPTGQVIDIQFGLNPTEKRNGVLMTELLTAIVDYLDVYQSPTSQMRSRETALAITDIETAIGWLNHRQIDRQMREVRFEDKP